MNDLAKPTITPRRRSSRSRLLACLTLFLNLAVVSSPQEPTLTNDFPTNLFLTDDNRLFSYRKGERVIQASKIQEAQRANESRPAHQDPEGHWGKVTDGFQLSLRFGKYEFTNGEPVTATILMRNVSGKPLTYPIQSVIGQPSPIYVSVWKDERQLRLKRDDPVTIVRFASNVTLQPRTQHKYRLQLDKFYDLRANGPYSVRAEYGSSAGTGGYAVRASGQEAITSQKVTISITNALAPRN
jgi:hypothetical protein